MFGFCLLEIIYCVWNIVLPDTLEVACCQGLSSQGNVTVEVVLHLLGSIL